MTWLPDAAEGAVIAGAVTLTGLLITKQSKVSEFRQEWINALRDDVALLITHTLEIHATDGIKEAASSFAKIHETTARIQLRLNPEEQESISMFTAMSNLREAIHSVADFAQVNARVEELIRATQVVLKKEWRRVKTGEPFYRWTFRAVVAGLLLLILVFLYHNRQWLLHFLGK